MAELPPEQQNKVKEMAQEMRMEPQLYRIREVLEISQQQIAQAMNIKQPLSCCFGETWGNDVRLSSVKRYVEAIWSVEFICSTSNRKDNPLTV